MKGLEFNKIVAGVLIAALIGMVGGKFSDIVYRPKLTPEKRGFEVAVTESTPGEAGGAPAAPIEIKIGQLMAKADAAAGADVAKKCTTCHTFDKGGPNRVGPNLYAILGAKRANKDGYAYSDAMKAKGGNWSYEEMYHYLNNPKAVVPGTKMAFAGLKKPEDLANIIAYLRSQADSQQPLPAVEQ